MRFRKSSHDSLLGAGLDQIQCALPSCLGMSFPSNFGVASITCLLECAPRLGAVGAVNFSLEIITSRSSLRNWWRSLRLCRTALGVALRAIGLGLGLGLGVAFAAFAAFAFATVLVGLLGSFAFSFLVYVAGWTFQCCPVVTSSIEGVIHGVEVGINFLIGSSSR